MAFLDKNVIFRSYFELEAIARQSVEASREVICAYFGNIDRNSGYFLLRIFLSSHPTDHLSISCSSDFLAPIQDTLGKSLQGTNEPLNGVFYCTFQ